MTQPCHKDTALNQQYCDSKHKSGRAEEQDKTRHTLPSHNTLRRAPQCECADSTHHRTSPPTTNMTTQDRRGTGTIQEGQEQCEGERTIQGAKPNPNTGQHSTPHSRHSIRPQDKRQGEGRHTNGDADIRREASNTAALHSPCHPPSTTAPHHPRRPHPPPRRGGGQTEDTPPHEQHRHTLTTHTPHTWQGTVHDMTAVLASTAVG